MNKQKIESEDYTVKAFDQRFIEKYKDYEKYVALTPQSLSTVSGWENKDQIPFYDSEALLKITFDKTSIYRKGVGYTAEGFNGNEIMIGYRSRKILGVDDTTDFSVNVSKTCWFAYLWHHFDSAIRWPFRIAVIFGLTSILFSLASILLNIIQLVGC